MNKRYHKLMIGMMGLISFLIATTLPVAAQDVDIHGFISQGFLQTDKNNYLAETQNGSFQFNEMGINFTTYVADDLKVGCQFFARDLGQVGNDEVTVNWAFAEYTYRNWLGLRAGLIKMPFGFYNDTRDFDSLRTSILLPSSAYNEWFRDAINSMKGLELFGTIPMGALGLLKYQAQIGRSQLPLDSGTARFISEVNQSLNIKELTEINVGRGYIGALQWKTPVEGLKIGVTYLNTDNYWEGITPVPIPGVGIVDLPLIFTVHTLEYWVYSAEYIWQNLTLTYEHYIAKRDADALVAGRTIDSDITAKSSFYVSAGYRFTDWFGAAYYWSRYVADPDKDTDDNELIDQCLSLRFDLNMNWIAKVEAHYMDGEFGVESDNDGHVYKEWMLYAAKLSFSF